MKETRNVKKRSFGVAFPYRGLRLTPNYALSTRSNESWEVSAEAVNAWLIASTGLKVPLV